MLHYVFSCKLRALSCGNYWSNEIILYAEHHLHIPRLPAHVEAVCWGKATIATEPSNKHNPYVVAVFENVGAGQQVALAESLAFVL